MGTGDQFPNWAQILLQFASPFQHRAGTSGPVAWWYFPATEADIAQAEVVMAGARAEELFFTSPSPGQIARYRSNRYDKTEEDPSTLADVMAREYRAIVDAGLGGSRIADLAISTRPLIRTSALRIIGIITANVEALNYVVKDLPIACR